MVRVTDRPDMTLDVYRGRKQQNNNNHNNTKSHSVLSPLLKERGANCFLKSTPHSHAHSNLFFESNSRNEVPRVAQLYETKVACTRCRAFVLVVFVVFKRVRARFCRFDKADATADTAITDRHSDINIFQPRARWVRKFWSIGSEKSFVHVPPVGVEPSTSCVDGKHPHDH